MVAMTNKNDIRLFLNAKDLCQFAANDFSQRAISAVNEKGLFSVVLSGGNTPILFFDILTEHYKNKIPWQQIQIFFGDERYVPSTDVESNYHMAYEHLFSKVAIHPEQIYRIPTELSDPNEAAKDYQQTLRKVFHLSESAFPPFDCLYLGLGDNGHTASLMPSSDIVMHYINNPLPDKNNELVAALFVPELNIYRITLTPPAINNAKAIIFLVTGANKATAVAEVLEGPTIPQHYPAQLIHCVNGKTMWYLDQAAAKKLNILE
jgi:6-phosphogluconolactonase